MKMQVFNKMNYVRIKSESNKNKQTKYLSDKIKADMDFFFLKKKKQIWIIVEMFMPDRKMNFVKIKHKC